MQTINTDHWHRIYRACETAPKDSDAAKIADLIDRSTSAVFNHVQGDGFGINGADPAERLVAALTAFFFESNPSFLGCVPTDPVTDDDMTDDDKAEQAWISRTAG